MTAAGTLVAREVALKRDRQLFMEVADDAVVRELMNEVDEDGALRRVTPPREGGEA